MVSSLSCVGGGGDESVGDGEVVGSGDSVRFGRESNFR